METRLYFQMLRRGWWIVVLTVLVALVVALAASYFATPMYTATARVLVSPSSRLVTSADVLHTIDTLGSQSVLGTYAEVMNSAQIYNNTLAALNLQATAVSHYTHAAKVVSNSSVLQVDVTGPNPQTAARLANTICAQSINFSSGLSQVYTVAILDTAVPPVLPSSPQPLVNAALALVAGLLVGIVLAIASEQLRTPLEAYRQRLRLDSMTDAYNSRYFTRLVDEELAQGSKEPLSMAIVELSGMRDLVDTLPIAGLQKVNRDVTQVLRRELRGNDVIGRWNDFSFGVMLPNTTGPAARRIFERIQTSLSQPVQVDQLNLVVNLDSHIGAAATSKLASSHELFECATEALEQTRREVDGRVSVKEA
jgi:diguanylate cyclase (GGDEF)-like protein